MSFVVIFVFFKRNKKLLSKTNLFYWFYFFLLTASHGILDTLTNGGLGIALLSPFSDQRFFFWGKPIQVSPIGLKAFLNNKSLIVLKSEFLWVWLPFLTATTLLRLGQLIKKKIQWQNVLKTSK